MLGVIAFYLAITFLVAIVAPPNTNDSMQYHMSRVMHWIVNRSVDFFPTPSDRQLWMPPFAEYAILHFQILAGSDLFANLVQWLAMVGSVIGVSLIASRLGAGQKGQVFAALFAVTLPMGVLQSTSTQTDYVAAFWGVCFAFFAISESNRFIDESSGRLSINSILLALAFGLGILTKGTFVVCAVPFLIWLLGVLVWKRKWKTAIALAMLGLAGLLLLNASLWWKNYLLLTIHWARQQTIWEAPCSHLEQCFRQAFAMPRCKWLSTQVLPTRCCISRPIRFMNCLDLISTIRVPPWEFIEYGNRFTRISLEITGILFFPSFR